MAQEQSIREDFDTVQWKLFYFPDFSATESYFAYKIHHSLADGIAMVLMTSLLTDNPDVNDFPRITARISLL